jgi:hypothetical protein
VLTSPRHPLGSSGTVVRPVRGIDRRTPGLSGQSPPEVAGRWALPRGSLAGTRPTPTRTLGPAQRIGPGARSVEAVLLVRVGQRRLTHWAEIVGSVSKPGGYLPPRAVPGEQRRGEEYASPGSCTLPSRRSMHWVVLLGVDRKQPTKGGSLQPESISLGRRVGRFRERWFPRRVVRVREQARGLPTQSRNSRLPPPAP